MKRFSSEPTGIPLPSGDSVRRRGSAGANDTMEPRTPVRLVLAEFEDLVSHGLLALVCEDPNIEVVANRVPHDRLRSVVARERPQVVGRAHLVRVASVHLNLSEPGNLRHGLE